jgi:hypothetical protein
MQDGVCVGEGAGRVSFVRVCMVSVHSKCAMYVSA